MDSSAAAPICQEYRSRYFALRFLPEPVTEKNAPLIAARLEAIREALISLLEITDPLDSTVRVVLGETLDGQPGRGDGDSAFVDGGQIRVPSRTDGPGKGLERAVVEVLLSSALGLRAERTAMLLDGVTGCVVQKVDALEPGRVNAALLDLRRAGHPLALSDAVRGQVEGPRATYYQVATSFVAYLLATRGAEPLRRLAREFDPETPDRAAEIAYGAPMSVLEQGWLGSLDKAQPAPFSGIWVLFQRGARYLRPYWKQEIVVLLATLVISAFTIIQPLAFKLIIDRAIVPGDYRFLALISGGLILLFVLQALSTLIVEYFNARVGAGVLGDLRVALFRHLQRLPVGYYAQAQTGDVMSRLSDDAALVSAAVTGLLVQSVYLSLTVTVSVVLLLLLEWRLALLALAVVPLVFVGPRLFGSRAAAASYEQQQENAALASTLQEDLGAYAFIKAFGLQDHALVRFRERVARVARSAVRATFIASLLGLTGELSVTFIQVLTLAVGSFMVMGDQLTLGALVAFTGLLGNVLGPVHGFSNLLENAQHATGGLRRIDELLAEHAQVDAPDAIQLPRLAREIRFADVTFSYTGEQANLKGVGLAIRAGESVAVVGPSGCGKSTILNLVLRFYDPTAGAVTMDGLDLRRATQASLRAQIATVLQDTFLFNASIRENIRLGRPEASDAAVEAAARAAEIDALIRSLPGGYDSLVGERGARLSGGQRQRIAIARAILRDAPILLLDEATSALDAQTEAAIATTLAKLAAGRTTVMVTHRLASVAHADRIFVLEGGQLVEQGTHDELLARHGLYRRLWEQQGGVDVGPGGRLGGHADTLQSVPLFSTLDGVLLAALAREFTMERYAEGEIVFREGDPGQKLYIVTRGEVEVVTTGPTGEERRLAVLREGDYFGEMALLHEAPRSATVRARVASVLLTLDRVQFLGLLRAIPDLRAAFERVVEARERANRAVLA